MKKCLYILLNKTFKKELELLYGKGSNVDITNISYCTNNKHYSLQCQLYITDIDLFEESNTEGLEFLMRESWKFIGLSEEKLALITSVDFI